MIIRLANLEDAEQITTLCQQLGYPTSQAAVQQRLNQIQQWRSPCSVCRSKLR